MATVCGSNNTLRLNSFLSGGFLSGLAPDAAETMVGAVS